MKGDILVIGRFIMIKRKELGIERKDLAKNLDISYNYLNLIETEKRKVSKKLIPKLAKELKVTEKEIQLYNTTGGYDYKSEKALIKSQIKGIDKNLTQLTMVKMLLQNNRDYLCKKLAELGDDKNAE